MSLTNQSKKLSIAHRPLQASGAIEVVGSVPGRQVYQADRGEHTPDYTLTPLTLFPRCNATDPDSLTKGQGINAGLTNLKWYQTLDNTRTLIETTDTGYAITQSGEEKGKIQVKKNVMPGHALTLDFYAEYTDSSRTGETLVFRYTFLITCVDGSEAVPVLMVDSPSGGLDWNPLRDPAGQKLTAMLLVAGEDVTDTDKCKIFFYRVLPETGALELISDGNGDNDWEVTAIEKAALTIDRNYIGHEQTYVVKASYDPEGNPAATPDDAIAYAATTIRRRIPALECDWQGVPLQVPDGTTVIRPKPIVSDTRGVLDNPWDVLRADWYKATSAAATYSLAAQGEAPSIPFTDGMMLKLEVADRGPYAAVTNDDGTKYIADSAGRVVMARKSTS